MVPVTQFADTVAVEAWDMCFRWRDGSGLRDRTIDSTWRRVADAVMEIEGANAAVRANRLVDAFSHWRLLPDERLLRNAGTGAVITSDEPLVAVLNIGAFVVDPLSTSARLDLERVAEIAAMAVRLLDDAVLAIPCEESADNAVRVGLIGMADALYMLDLPYDSSPARQKAREVAVAMANGTLRGAIELARERGAAHINLDSLVALWRNRGTSSTLIDDALHWGVRHTRITEIKSQPKLALLANNASDALDPLLRVPRLRGNRSFACLAAHIDRADPRQRLAAQVELRAAMQPWIDTAIDYPLATITEPSQDEIEAVVRLAAHYRLPPPRVRCADAVTRISADRRGGP